jgi:parallel beta-helix repeat protein
MQQNISHANGFNRVALSALVLSLMLLSPIKVFAAETGKILTVAADGSGTHTSVQAAIDDAPDGAVIRIAPGVYRENLVIRKSLTLEGKDWQQTTLSAKLLWNGSAEELKSLYQQRMKDAGPGADREAVQAKLLKELFKPVLSVEVAREVVIQGLKFTNPKQGSKQGSPPDVLIRLKSSKAIINNCALVGSPGSGIEVADGSDVEIRNSLVAAMWNTGIAVGSRGTKASNLVVSDSDVRNCYYSGIVIRSGNNNVRIERWRVSGAAWHGIRYDDASPRITGNLIFSNARSGIYASGNTSAIVQNNLFYRNEMDGISCWFNNRDTIENNTFACNLSAGLDILGASAPTIQSNVLTGHPTALYQRIIDSNKPSAQTLGAPRLQENLFWNNQKNWVRMSKPADPSKQQPETLALGEETRSFEADPKFNNPQAGDFSVASDSIVLQHHLGAVNPLGIQSPWPLQPEERAIIPDTDTRDYSKWKGNTD